MTKNEYIAELKGRLKKLPYDEVHEALTFYEQYFDDAAESGRTEAEITEELGSPASAALQIIAKFAVKESKDPESKTGRGIFGIFSVIGILIAGTVALPVAFGIAATLFFIILAAGITLAAVWFTGIASAVAGIVSAVVGAFALFIHFPTGLFVIGSGLAAFGVGILIFLLTTAAAKAMFGLFGRLIGRIGRKKPA